MNRFQLDEGENNVFDHINNSYFRMTKAEKRAAARQKESLLALELNMSTAKLAYATAVALRRGHANGEVEEGIRAYNEAKKKYVDFLNAQASEHLAG